MHYFTYHHISSTQSQGPSSAKFLPFLSCAVFLTPYSVSAVFDETAIVLFCDMDVQVRFEAQEGQVLVSC